MTSSDAAVETRVLIVDDHKLFAQALSAALEQEPGIVTTGIAENLAAALDAVTRTPVDVVLLDYRLPDATGVEGVGRLVEAAPGIAVVMVTASEDERVLLAAVEAGCAGFVSKTADMADIHTAVRKAAAGEPTIAPSLLPRLLSRLAQRGTGLGSDLTSRERDVLRAISNGRTNSEIARELFLSVNTVRNHVQSVLTKLGAHSKLEAAAIAVREGLVNA
ncbi:MAG: response regulator [Jatrophihabitans sp.]|uniref:response regulator n=1 Tax=Jatrophihabitans sp. TaxID=1932789 RepID=UPI003F817EDE